MVLTGGVRTTLVPKWSVMITDHFEPMYEVESNHDETDHVLGNLCVLADLCNDQSQCNERLCASALKCVAFAMMQNMISLIVVGFYLVQPLVRMGLPIVDSPQDKSGCQINVVTMGLVFCETWPGKTHNVSQAPSSRVTQVLFFCLALQIGAPLQLECDVWSHSCANKSRSTLSQVQVRQNGDTTNSSIVLWFPNIHSLQFGTPCHCIDTSEFPRGHPTLFPQQRVNPFVWNLQYSSLHSFLARWVVLNHTSPVLGRRSVCPNTVADIVPDVKIPHQQDFFSQTSH